MVGTRKGKGSNMTWDGKDEGPWGKAPENNQTKKSNPSGGKRNTPPDFDALMKKVPFGFGGLAIIAVLVWLASGFYKVAPDEQGVVLRFGKWVRTTQPGLQYHVPAPFETVIKPKVTRINRIDISDAYREQAREARRGALKLTLDTTENLILTGDEKLVTINFNVMWKIGDAAKFLFNVRNQEETIRAAAESVMRDVIGQTDSNTALAEGRRDIETKVQTNLQRIVNEYNMGVIITEINMQKADPPSPVIDAFLDVQRARADMDRMERQAEGFRNKIIPEARGDAERMIQEAMAYKQEKITRAQGEAERFNKILIEYNKAKDVTRRRLYIETMESIMKSTQKMLVDQSTQGVVPYLPLNKLASKEPTKKGE